jgi:transposase
MQKAAAPASGKNLPNPAELSGLSAPELLQVVQSLVGTVQSLQHQLEWFKRQHFGTKSERLKLLPNAQQLSLGEIVAAASTPPPPKTRAVAAHTRRIKTPEAAEEGESLPFFDETRVPIEIIELPAAETEGLSAEQFERIGQKVSYRLAQRPGSYVVLKYIRPLIKRRDTQAIHCAPAPRGVLEGSRADVSFIVGLLMDKFAWHLPLYRQHQRLEHAGIDVSRQWLTQLVQQGIRLLEPIYEAQLQSIRDSRVKAMDETPIKASRAGHGKMKTAYFWPVYGERDEVCFPFFPSRSAGHVQAALGLQIAAGSVLLSDGNPVYEHYAKKTGITHAQCWSHTRRGFFEAQAVEPQGVLEALEQIRRLYAIEEDIRKNKLTGESKRLHRLTHSKPLVEIFFEWIDRQFERQDLLPSNPFTQALAYARERTQQLQVFLEDPDVPIDTNHLERALRVIPMGRKNFLFCWTELGAEHVGIVQSLIVTCRLQGIDPYTYLVDVLQRVGEHPASKVAELTPRLWKTLFAANPMRSDLHCLRQ